jgi:hypothetical protein
LMAYLHPTVDRIMYVKPDQARDVNHRRHQRLFVARSKFHQKKNGGLLSTVARAMLTKELVWRCGHTYYTCDDHNLIWGPVLPKRKAFTPTLTYCNQLRLVSLIPQKKAPGFDDPTICERCLLYCKFNYPVHRHCVFCLNKLNP